MPSHENEEHTTCSNQQSTKVQPRKQDTRGVSPAVYELFVLGELMVQPTYGYRLHEIANRLLGPWRPLSWGILYPLIHRLEQEGLTTSSLEKRRRAGFPETERGRPRHIYSITEAGKSRFFHLMLTSAEYGRDTPELFFIKLTKLQFLTPAQRISVLHWYRRYISDLHIYYQRSREEILNDREITDRERPYIIQLTDYRYHILQAEISWLDNMIALGTIAQLTVRGRKSGQPRTTPISIVESNGRSYLIASFGVVNWVQNLRATGEAILIRDRHAETISAIELPPKKAAPILKECLTTSSGIARLCFDIPASPSLMDFEREALEHPVFQLNEM